MHKKAGPLIFYIAIACVFIAGCSSNKTRITKLDDAKESKIGVMTGTTGEQLALKRFPKAQVKSFDDIMDAVGALKSDQIDAVITAYPTAMNVCKKNKDLMYLEEPVDFESTSIGMRKGETEMLKQLNAFIADITKDGTLKDMKRRWFKTDLSPYETADIIVPEKGKILKVGVSATREPFCFIDSNKRVTGHDGELAKRVAVKLNRPLEFIDMKFSALITALQSGKIDLIISGMTATDERKKSIDFTEMYFQNSQVMMVKKPVNAANNDGKISSVDDIKNKKIGVLLGSVHDTYALKHYPDAEIKQYKNPSELVLAVTSGKVDAAIYTHENILEILKTESSLTQLGDTLFTVPIAIGFNKENIALREQFNSFFKNIKNNGVFQDMVDRWLIRGNYDQPVIKPKNVNGTLIVGNVSDKGLPFTIIKDGKLIGFDIELIERFAASIGKQPKFMDMEFGSLIVAAETKKIDLIASTLMITEERAKQIAFSEPYYRLGASIIVLKKNLHKTDPGIIRTLDDIADKRIGIYAGTVFDGFVTSHYPNAILSRFNGTPDMILALKTGKLDAAFFDLYSGKHVLRNNPELRLLSDAAYDLPCGYGFNKSNTKLKDEFNRYLAKIKSDGTYDSIYKKWFLDDIEKAVMPKFEDAKNAPVIRLGVAIGDLPYSGYVNNEYVGMDIELLKSFAHSMGYKLEIKTMDFAALIASLASGKVDIIADGICITPERSKQVAFSEPYIFMKTAVLANKSSLGEDAIKGAKDKTTSFFESIASSFRNNIISERRYVLIIDGLKTTAIISILSILFGTMLGGLICFMRMSNLRVLQVPAKIYISLLRGTPVLVVLMIIFYVVFASVDVSPTVVAIIAFGMNFAAYVSEMFRTGIESIDRGQTEAGIAVGFTKIQTFIYIILPQVSRRVLPVYKGELISLVKMTSIVGYIAVQDLTKASDIIRSRTFDAFFPLIMVAVLYFIISWLLMALLGYTERRANPKSIVKVG